MGELWLPDETGQIPLITASSAPAAANYSSNDEHKARTPPPDLPSLLLDSRIVFLGMPVQEQMIASSICIHNLKHQKGLHLSFAEQVDQPSQPREHKTTDLAVHTQVKRHES